MKKRIHEILTFTLVGLALMSCGLMDIMDEITAEATQTAVEQANPTQQAPEEEKELPTGEPRVGTITGKIAYPSEFLPPQRVIAFDVNDPSVYYAVEIQSSASYRLDVPVGTYFVLAYLIDPASLGATPGINAAYSEVVLCGLQYGCDDHSLVPVMVSAGQTVPDIDPVDWYLLPGADAGWPDDPFQTETGTISGNLGFPSEYIPPMRVVAFDVFSADYYFVDTELNQGTYLLEGLPAGTYNVVAFVRDQGPDMSGGYSFFVTCGMSAECADHTLIDVSVYAGQTTENVDPVDFYATPGESGWPENPSE